mgnify:CR=1 FL=1
MHIFIVIRQKVVLRQIWGLRLVVLQKGLLWMKRRPCRHPEWSLGLWWFQDRCRRRRSGHRCQPPQPTEALRASSMLPGVPYVLKWPPKYSSSKFFGNFNVNDCTWKCFEKNVMCCVQSLFDTIQSKIRRNLTPNLLSQTIVRTWLSQLWQECFWERNDLINYCIPQYSLIDV